MLTFNEAWAHVQRGGDVSDFTSSRYKHRRRLTQQQMQERAAYQEHHRSLNAAMNRSLADLEKTARQSRYNS